MLDRESCIADDTVAASAAISGGGVTDKSCAGCAQQAGGVKDREGRGDSAHGNVMIGYGCIQSLRIQTCNCCGGVAVFLPGDGIRFVVVHVGAGDQERSPSG